MNEPAWWDENGTPGPVMRECLVAAAAAPSIHNTQPWLFRPRGGVVDVLVDRRRRLAVADPDGREMNVSVGAAVFNLGVAVRAHGRPARVNLMPDPSEPDIVARVVVGSQEVAPGPAATALAEAIGRRHTNRRPFLDRPVPAQVLADLSAAAEHEGAVLLAADDALRDGVWSLTRTAENRIREHPSYRAELARWTTPGGVGRRDGVPRQAFGPRDVLGAIPLRDFALGNGAATATVTFEANPTVLLLFTTGDTRATGSVPVWRSSGSCSPPPCAASRRRRSAKRWRCPGCGLCSPTPSTVSESSRCCGWVTRRPRSPRHRGAPWRKSCWVEPDVAATRADCHATTWRSALPSSARSDRR